MQRRFFLALSVASLLLGLGYCQCGSECVDFNIFHPKLITPGMQITASVSIPKIADQVKVKSLFYAEDNQLYFENTTTIYRNAPALIKLGKIPLEYNGSKQFFMNITAYNITSGAVLFQNSTTTFHFVQKNLPIFIQTDKPIYKPSETIKFRGIFLTSDLFPIIGNVNYSVEDPQGNIVFSKKNVTLSRGVVADELPLSKFAEIGAWKINMSYWNFEKTLTVNVTNATSPKYDVTIEAPVYFYPALPGLTIKLNATYPTGEKVRGHAKILVALKSPEGEIITYSQITKKFMIFDGFLEVFISREDLMQTFNWDGISKPMMVVTGIVKEATSGFKYNDTTFIKITQSNIKVQLLTKLKVLKPGLPVNLITMVEEHDGKSLMESDRLANNLILKVIYSYGPNALPREEVYNFPIPLDGIVKLNFTARNDNFVSAMVKVFTTTTMRHKNEKNTLVLRRATSPSNSFIQIASKQTKFYPGKKGTIEIFTTNVVRNMKILILNRGEIIMTGIPQIGENNNLYHRYIFEVTQMMYPSVEVMAYYTTESNEIVTDSIHVPIEIELLNKVGVSIEEESILSGENVVIRVNASSYSFIGLQAINEEFISNPDEVANGFSPLFPKRISLEVFPNYFYSLFPHLDRRWGICSPSMAKDATEQLKNLEISTLTSATVFESRQEFPTVVQTPKKKESFLEKFMLMKFLSKFPQTSLWDQKTAPWDGNATFNITLPNKPSSWKLYCFALSYRDGLGIAAPLTLKTSDKLFISLDVPLEAKHNETAVAKVFVQNKLDHSLPVRVTLMIDDRWGILLVRPNNATEAGKIRHIQVPARGIVVVNYPIKFHRFGMAKVAVRAEVTRSDLTMIRDTVKRKTFVKPKGERKCFTETKLINRKFNALLSTVDMFKIKVPENTVRGTGELNITIYADVLGKLMNETYLKNKLPRGTGELNLPTFAAALFTPLYLKKTGRLYTNITKKYYENIIKSYMAELRYKQNPSDNRFTSFSSFGNKDSSIDIPLTTLVYKCFAYANELNPELIEPSLLNKTFSFLLHQQQIMNNASVSEMTKEEKLHFIKKTALIVIALQETTLFSTNETLKAVMINARQILENSLELFKLKQKPHLLSLVTYGLHLTYSTMAEKGMRLLKELAMTKQGEMFWRHEADEPKSCKMKEFSKFFPSSLDVETASYALLTYTLRGEFITALPILKWLVSKQNALGLYSTAMDSVVAVQALAKSSEILAWRSQNITLRFEQWGMLQLPINITDEVVWFNKTNLLDSVQYSTKISTGEDKILVNSSGIGMAIVESSLCYNTIDVVSKKKPFNCWYESEGFNFNRSLHLNFCCSPKWGQTGKILYKVEFMTGFKLNESNLMQNNPLAKNIEINKENVIMYYDGLSAQRNICASVYQARYQEVAAIQPANVTVWEYQKPEMKLKTNYTVADWDILTVCEVCGPKCLGCPAFQPRVTEQWTPCIEFCQSEFQTQIPTCFNPSLGNNSDASMCIESLNLQVCRKQDFPCPTFSDGLWYNLPSSLGSFEKSKCKLRGTMSRSATLNIPGSILNGQTSYIDCGNEEKLIDSGFTYSFLAKFKRNIVGPTQLLYVGGKYTGGLRPAVSLELTQRGSLLFEINYNGRRTVVTYLNPKLSKNIWYMITLTWSVLDQPKIYINGERVQTNPSRPISIPMEITPSESLSLFLGYGPGPEESTPGWGYFNGELSGLAYWHRVLTQQQITELFSFFYPLLDKNLTQEPILTPRHLNFFAPRSIHSCLKSPSRLSELYSTVLPQCKVDKWENLFGFPHVF